LLYLPMWLCRTLPRRSRPGSRWPPPTWSLTLANQAEESVLRLLQSPTPGSTGNWLVEPAPLVASPRSFSTA
jgi:hypothetical protein